MFYQVVTSVPPPYVWAMGLLLITLLVHHAVQGKKWWTLLTGLILSFVLGWLAETLGLGWYAAEFFGSRWIALLVYLTTGLIWLGFESACDLRQMIPRFEAYADDWCEKHDRGEWAAMTVGDRVALLRAELLPALENRNANNPRDPILYPRHYYRSRDRRWWFVSWFLFWPAYLLNWILSTVVIDPWKWLSHLLPNFVRWVVQRWVIPPDLPDVPTSRSDLRDEDDLNPTI